MLQVLNGQSDVANNIAYFLFPSGASINEKCEQHHCAIELAVAEKTLLALPPIKRTVATTITRMTAGITAYSAMS